MTTTVDQTEVLILCFAEITRRLCSLNLLYSRIFDCDISPLSVVCIGIVDFSLSDAWPYWFATYKQRLRCLLPRTLEIRTLNIANLRQGNNNNIVL